MHGKSVWASCKILQGFCEASVMTYANYVAMVQSEHGILYCTAICFNIDQLLIVGGKTFATIMCTEQLYLHIRHSALCTIFLVSRLLVTCVSGGSFLSGPGQPTKLTA